VLRSRPRRRRRARRRDVLRGIRQLDRSDGAVRGAEHRVAADQNGYDQQHTPDLLHCAYDPIDDGSTEDTYDSPSHPDWRDGPSSTSDPQWSFVRIGETSNTYDANAVGYAEGPGLQGLWGPGTRIESKFDLSRFRGRGIRVRFLVSTMNAYTALPVP